MGDVYLAEHEVLHRKVAIKVLPPGFARDPELIARFQREAVAVARLEHPNIVQVHDVGDEEGVHFIVMGYVDGRSLQAELDEVKKIPAPEAARIAAEVARGLEAAHKASILHRDIKPANILISSSREVRIVDFGLAADQDASAAITMQGTIMGTPHFLAPEQAAGKRAGERSDLYSLGVCLYVMVTGQRPFEGDTHMAVLYKHLHTKPRDPRRFEESIPDALASIILKLLEKSPDRRHKNAGELVVDLERFLRSAPARKFTAVRAKATSARPSAPSARPPPATPTPRTTPARTSASPTTRHKTQHPTTRTRGRLKRRPRVPPPAVIALLSAAALGIILVLVLVLSGDSPPENPPPTGKVPPNPPVKNPPVPTKPPVKNPPVPPKPPDDNPPPVRLIRGYELYPLASLEGCEHFSGRVLASGNSRSVAIPRGIRSDEDRHLLGTRENDWADFHVWMELKYISGRPGLATRSDKKGTRFFAIALERLPPGDWVEVLLRIEGGRCMFSVNGRVVSSGQIPSGVAPSGHFGFLFHPGDALEFRNFQFKVLKRLEPVTPDVPETLGPLVLRSKLTTDGVKAVSKRRYREVLDQIDKINVTLLQAEREELIRLRDRLVSAQRVVSQFQTSVSLAKDPVILKMRSGIMVRHVPPGLPRADDVVAEQIILLARQRGLLSARDVAFFLLIDGEALMALDHVIDGRAIHPDCKPHLDEIVNLALAQKRDGLEIAKRLFLVRDKLSPKAAVRVENEYAKRGE